jgi:hypothetical protein
MKKEEAELRLKRYHSKIFGKQPNAVINDNLFNVFGKLAQEAKSSTPMKLLDVLLIHLKLNESKQL